MLKIKRVFDLEDSDFSLNRPITSYYKIQKLIASLVRGKSFFVNQQKIDGKSYLDLGCGPNIHAQFVNLDYGWHPEVDLCWDITKGLPFKRESFHGLFTEHCLEHISFDHIIYILSDCLRVLRPGGVLRIVVPDGELYLKRYSDLIRGMNARPLPYADRDSYHGVYSPIMSVNRIFRGEGHLFIYDYDCLRQLLLRSGFSEVRRASFNEGIDPNLLIDTPSRQVESLYLEATK